MYWMRTIAVLLVCARLALPQGDSLNARIRRLLPSPQREQALAALEAHDYVRLQQLVTTLPDIDKSAQLLPLKGAIAFLASNMSGAAQYFQSANQLMPLTETDAFTWAMALVKLGNNDGSRTIISKLQADHSGNPLYIYWLGKIDYNQRRYDDAIVKLREALKLDPSSARAWDSLGLAYDMQGNAEEAQTALEKAAALNRTLDHPSPWPPHDLGYLLLRVNRAQEAEALLRESLRYDPALYEAHYHLGRALEKGGRDEQAIEEYKLAVVADQSASEACYSLGILYRKLNQTADASAMFDEYKKRKKLEGSAAPEGR